MVLLLPNPLQTGRYCELIYYVNLIAYNLEKAYIILFLYRMAIIWLILFALAYCSSIHVQGIFVEIPRGNEPVMLEVCTFS